MILNLASPPRLFPLLPSLPFVTCAPALTRTMSPTHPPVRMRWERCPTRLSEEIRVGEWGHGGLSCVILNFFSPHARSPSSPPLRLQPALPLSRGPCPTHVDVCACAERDVPLDYPRRYVWGRGGHGGLTYVTLNSTLGGHSCVILNLSSTPRFSFVPLVSALLLYFLFLQLSKGGSLNKDTYGGRAAAHGKARSTSMAKGRGEEKVRGEQEREDKRKSNRHLKKE